ncbi:MAG: type I-E CRISPR-associated protein Cas6/Cse3/CasE [Nitrospira sp.]|nr:type I-E CRISPR-associated protein Cas6/Cse3/CasE [Nitrospira sp.]
MADPYQLHATLCRAFSPPDQKCPEGEILWRLEPETRSDGFPRVLVQSRTIPDWDGIGVKSWLAEVDSPIDLKSRLKLGALTAGQRFRFRLRANPCVTRNGKRLGLLQLVEQEQWIKRKGLMHGFLLPELPSLDLSEEGGARIDVRVSQEQMLTGRQHHGNSIRIFSVLYDGVLTVTDVSAFVKVLQTGIGHGKSLGLGLLSVAPIA